MKAVLFAGGDLQVENYIHKCEFITIGDMTDVEAKPEVLGCSIGKLPSTYIGLPLGAKFKFV